MSEPAFDRLLRRLSEADVQFVLIGGLALNAWGVIRGTKDVDVVVASDPDNLRRLADLAGRELNGHIHTGESLPSSPPSVAGQLLTGERALIETDLGPLDVVHGLDGVPAYDELKSRATETEVLGVKVLVCSLADLKAMKQAAGRTRDQADLEDLDAAGH